jgi:hypothetical protein
VSKQPYPATQTARLAVKPAISTKGTFPSKNTTTKVQVKCGFEVRRCGKWLAKQATITASIDWSNTPVQAVLEPLCSTSDWLGGV